MSQRKPIAVGLAGAGFFGASLARACPAAGLDVLLVSDQDPSNAESLANEIGAEVTDWDGLIADDRIDLVMIATPNFTHEALVLDALAAGKHVFVEKPLAISAGQATRIVESATGAAGELLVGHILRTLPGLRRLHEFATSGGLGTLLEATGTRERVVHTPPDESTWWKLDRTRSGGELLHEIHELDLIVWFLGDPAEVVALAGAPDPSGRHTSPSIHRTLMTFPSGAIALHDISTSAHDRHWTFRISGDTAAAVVDFWAGRVDVIVEGVTTQTWGIFEDDEANESIRSGALARQGYNVAGATAPYWMDLALRHELQSVADAVVGLESPLRALPAAAVHAGARAMDLIDERGSSR